MGALRIQNVIRREGSPRTFLRGTRYCRAAYCDDQQATLYSDQVLQDESHPFFPRIKNLYTTRDPKTLWWRVYSGLKVSPKATVRNWCRRRMQVAFVEALREHGYDRHGRAVGDGNRVPCPPEGLVGTLDIHVNANVIPESYLSVREEASRILDGVVKKVNDRTKHPSNLAYIGRGSAWKALQR